MGLLHLWLRQTPDIPMVVPRTYVLGLGLAAVSYDGHCRSANAEHLDEYLTP